MTDRKYYCLFSVLISLFIFGCKKDETKLIVHGTMRHAYTHAPIPNRYLEAFEESPGILGADSERLDSVNTDANGNFTLKIDMENSGHTLFIQSYREGPFDSTKFENLFESGNYWFKLSEIPQALSIDLEPSGYIVLAATTSSMDSLGVDTIVVSSPYQTKLFIKGQWGQTFFHVDPYQTHLFKWHYLKKGIPGSEIRKYIYVPNYHLADGQSGSAFFHPIRF